MQTKSLENIPAMTEIVRKKEKRLITKKDGYIVFKRISDVAISSLGLIVLMPFMILIGILIKIDSKGCILYKQLRIGKNGKKFIIYKYRTMVTDSDNLKKYFTKEQMKEFYKNFKLESDPRITKIGKFLRKTSLDELPQLINIIKGDLSIVGPRPVVEDEIEKYGVNKDKFLSVTPGLTGNWAANGRNATTYEERINLELKYIENISLKMDLEIIFKTFIAVVKREGAM